jgi:hypothetical protein
VLGGLHHVELWVPDLTRASTAWGWLLGQLGYAPFQDWADGCSWRLGTTYLAAEGAAHGWTLLFPDRHPHAGGPDHYAAYLANTDGFEVELVAGKT